MLFSGKKTLPQPSEKRISERKQEGRKNVVFFCFFSFDTKEKKRKQVAQFTFSCQSVISH